MELSHRRNREEITKKPDCLCQLKCFGLITPEQIQFYKNCIRPITGYACPMFHDSLPTYLSKDIEMVQRRAMVIVFPSLTYKEALDEAGLISLSDRRQLLTDKLFNKVATDRENNLHDLHNLLPTAITSHYELRRQRRFQPTVRTNRFENSFLVHNFLNFLNSYEHILD